MEKHISTYWPDNEQGRAEVWVNFKEEAFFIKYFDENNKQFFTEDFPNKSMRYVEDAAENWALGIKQLAV